MNEKSHSDTIEEEAATLIASDTAVFVDNPRPYVDWSAVLAGAVISSASLLLLLHFGAAIGLSVANPFKNDVDATAVSIAAAAYFALATVYSVGMGAYFAGRMRARADDSNADEVSFRDGANGLVVWAVGLILSALLSVATLSSAVGAVGGVAATTSQELVAGMVDSVTRVQPQANASEGAASDQASVSRAVSTGRSFDAGEREEFGRLLGVALRDGELAQDDRTYLAARIANRTGRAQSDVEAQIDATLQTAQDTAQEAAEIAALAGFWSVFVILVSGLVAWAAGAIAGSHRDGNLNRSASIITG